MQDKVNNLKKELEIELDKLKELSYEQGQEEDERKK